MTDENDEDIILSFGVYWKLYWRYYGPAFFFCANGVMCLFVTSRLANDYLVGTWAFNDD